MKRFYETGGNVTKVNAPISLWTDSGDTWNERRTGRFKAWGRATKAERRSTWAISLRILSFAEKRTSVSAAPRIFTRKTFNGNRLFILIASLFQRAFHS